MVTCRSEFTSRNFDAWAYEHKVAIDYIMPGKPTQNGCIESFNGKFGEECLSGSWFRSLPEAQTVLDRWVDDYNKVRPHSSLANLAPLQYLARVVETTVSKLNSPREIYQLAVDQFFQTGSRAASSQEFPALKTPGRSWAGTTEGNPLDPHVAVFTNVLEKNCSEIAKECQAIYSQLRRRTMVRCFST
jgi:hypothetical protein